MTSSNPDQNSVFVVPPSRTISFVPLPAPPYSDNQPPVHLHNGYQIQMISPYREEDTVQKIWKESKVLGAIQIIIGLLHIGFGTVLVTTVIRGYTSISFFGGYPYWGGISFIISGTLSVLSQKASATYCIMSRSVGMNIISAIFSIIGIIFFIMELSLYPDHYPISPHTSYYIVLPYCPYTAESSQRELTLVSLETKVTVLSPSREDAPYFFCFQPSGKGISSTLLLFSILELVITCISSHSGCLIVCFQSNQVVGAATVPPVPIVNPMIIPQIASRPPLTVVNGQP
ncbi:membrane-spanning 4-domains subfamily A member 8 [Sarcophilus harrisii]|uniref:membrane-spanning 4-domains subfamily A member 8 n=1 Tax=Sarcophilus harrisii TaxID=9305 RepID=UPI001301DF38|nr:membrane-spanning 4-domains subfamily A member 8 [Sarcophilus harrisii]